MGASSVLSAGTGVTTKGTRGEVGGELGGVQLQRRITKLRKCGRRGKLGGRVSTDQEQSSKGHCPLSAGHWAGK